MSLCVRIIEIWQGKSQGATRRTLLGDAPSICPLSGGSTPRKAVVRVSDVTQRVRRMQRRTETKLSPSTGTRTAARAREQVLIPPGWIGHQQLHKWVETKLCAPKIIADGLEDMVGTSRVTRERATS